MNQLLEALEADPTNPVLLLDTLKTVSKKLYALQDGLIAIEPALPDTEKQKLRGILAQELLTELD